MRMKTLLSTFLMLLAVASPLRAADIQWQQVDWQAGASPGSSTTAQTGWNAYDSDNGTLTVDGTGAQNSRDIPKNWVQTSTGSDLSAFDRPGSILSTTTALGSGDDGRIEISLAETAVTRADTLGTPREQMAISSFALNGKIYLFGGVDPDGSYTDEIVEYDPASGSTRTMNSRLPGRTAGMAAVYDNLFRKIFLFGGRFENGVATTTVLEYNPLSDLYSYVAALSTPASHMSAVYSDVPFSTVYLFGGRDTDGNYLDHVLEYSKFAQPQIKTAVLPSGRSEMGAARDLASGMILLFGGKTGATLEDDILEYNRFSDSLAVKSSVLPSSRAAVSAHYHRFSTKTYIFGGTDGNPLSQILEYDLSADSLKVRPVVLPSSRSHTSAIFTEDSLGMRVFGGTGTAGGFDEIVEYFFVTSGTFVSSTFDAGNISSLTAVYWNPASQSHPETELRLFFRSDPAAPPAGAWAEVLNGQSLAAFGDSRYWQYKAEFQTTEPSTSPVLRDLRIAYTQTASSSALDSSVFDTGNVNTSIQELSWDGTFPPQTETRFQLATASTTAPAQWTFQGPTGPGDFYLYRSSEDAINPEHSDGIDDQYLRYRFILISSNTSDTTVISSVTLSYNFRPPPPTLSSLRTLSTTQIRVEWIDNSQNEEEFRLYWRLGVTPTSVTIPSPDTAGAGGVLVSTITGLLANQPYEVWLDARNATDDIASATSTVLSTTTFANPPANVALSSVTLSSFTLSWEHNGNPIDTEYEVSISTDDFLSDLSIPRPFALFGVAPSTTVLALAQGTTYFIRVRARSKVVLDSTVYSASLSTQTLPARVQNSTGAVLGTSSIAWNWDFGGAATRYRVYTTTIGGSPPPAAALIRDTDQTSFTQTDLLANRIYGILIEAYNGTGAAEISDPHNRYTHAEAPAGLTAAAQSTGSIRLSWSAGQNPGYTRYEIVSSSDGFVNLFSTRAAFSDNYRSIELSTGALASGTTYSFRVTARNVEEVETPQRFASTQTFPGLVTFVTGTTLGVSSIAWSWTQTAGPAVDYFEVFRASDGRNLAVVNITSFTDTGLAPNTENGIRVRAVGGSGPGALTFATTRYTLASPPAGTAISDVHIDSLTVTWTYNGNIIGTRWEVQQSTDGASYAVVLDTQSTEYHPFGLLGDTTHYFRVRAINGNGLPSPFDVAVSTYLPGELPDPPRNLRAAPIGGARIRLDWDISPTTTVTRYNVYYDSGTGTVDYSVLLASVPGSVQTYTTDPLAADTTYVFGLRAVDPEGEEDTNTWLKASAVALLSSPTLSLRMLSPPAGAVITGNHVTLAPELLYGSLSEVASVLYEYRPKGLLTWLTVPAADAVSNPNPATRAPFAPNWDVSALPAGLYELRAGAVDAAGTRDPFPPAVTVFVDHTAGAAEIEENITAGRIVKRVKLFNGISARTAAADPVTGVLTTVVFSSGTLDADSDFIRIDGSPAGAPPVPSSFSYTGIIREITLESGQSYFAGGGRLSIEFSQLDRDGDNRVDGTEVRADNMVIVTYDTTTLRWDKSLPYCAVRGDNGTTAACETPHLSLFALVSPVSVDVAQVRVYPVPFKPANGLSDDGKPYSSGDPTSGIIFDTLPMYSRIKVYTVAGSLVWESPENLTGGLYRWDVRNGAGADVASGIYFAVIEAPGSVHTVRKLAVIR